MGWINIKQYSIPLDSKYSNSRISFDGKYWYISVGFKRELPKIELTDESIGIYVGVKDLAICSNDMTFKNINKTKEIKSLKKKTKKS